MPPSTCKTDRRYAREHIADARRILFVAQHPSKDQRQRHDTQLRHIRPMIEAYPLERAAEAYERMMSGKARFRVVLTTGR